MTSVARKATGYEGGNNSGQRLVCRYTCNSYLTVYLSRAVSRDERNRRYFRPVAHGTSSRSGQTVTVA